MDIKVGNVDSIAGLASQVLGKGEKPNSQELAKSFGEIFSKALGDVNDKLNTATDLKNKLASGEITDLHDVMIATQKADVALQFTVQVRNLLVRAYNDINRLR